jgi:HAD superfamily hydrolase (TIGR01490 family)
LRSVTRTLSTALRVPMFMAADFYSRTLFNDIFFGRYKGESEDRLRYLADELFENVLKPSIFPGAYELIDKSRRLGLRQVLVTGALDLTVRPLARHLGIDDAVTNRLEYVDGKATGRLLPPIMAAATKASWMRTYAEKEGLSLSECYSYSDSMSDLPMLSVVGHPTAVNPDFRLRSTALQHDWPILDLR